MAHGEIFQVAAAVLVATVVVAAAEEDSGGLEEAEASVVAVQVVHGNGFHEHISFFLMRINLQQRLKTLAKRITGRTGFEGSAQYWDNRYRADGNSGSGSFNKLALFKADFLNGFVKENKITSVIEWGCGDGNQLLLAEYPEYTGLDVSKAAIAKCRKLFGNRSSMKFEVTGKYRAMKRAKLALSLDVIYHLVEDDVYHQYMQQLFSSAEKFVIIYSCDFDSTQYPQHVRPRKFSEDVHRWFPDWQLSGITKNAYPLESFGETNGSWSDFYIYSKNK